MAKQRKANPDKAGVTMAKGAVTLMRLNASFHNYAAQITAFKMACIMADAVADIFHKTVTDLQTQQKRHKGRRAP